jgi:phage terminase Nu1 subunit (DNA packaging protein)
VSDLRSLSETASFFSVSQPTIRRWIDAGCPVAEKGASGVAYKLDLQAVARWRHGQREAEDAATTFRAERDAQLRLELLGDDALTVAPGSVALTPRQRADALLAEVTAQKLAILRQAHVEADPLKLLLAEAFATCKTRIRQIPDIIAPEVNLTDPQATRLAEALDDALNDLADALETLTDVPAS